MDIRKATNTSKTAMLTLIPLLLAMAALAIADAGQADRINVGAELPPRIRALLIQEMQEIDKASQQIHAAIVQGDHDTVALKAQAIHDSFIMEQEMSPADEEALLAAVPKAFLALDEELHELSSKLAEAARARDTKLQMQKFAQMTKGCVGCHSTYASARFPGLDSTSP